MPNLADLVQQGTASFWLLMPSAVLLGALHGLEPGHSKTMMAAFIIAIRGTVAQAGLLGLAATISHTAIVWAVALAGLHFGGAWSAETSEPYFQIASSVLIIAVALWMLWRAWRGQRPQGHSHTDHHGAHGHDDDHDHDLGGVLQSVGADAADSHEIEHADQIRRRFAGRRATTGEIVLFGLTGGLVPCPAAITVLIVCLQLKEVRLGAEVVLGFSIGLALTLVASGVLAAWSVRHARRRWPGFDEIFRRAPYVSGGLILCVGFVMAYSGWSSLH